LWRFPPFLCVLQQPLGRDTQQPDGLFWGVGVGVWQWLCVGALCVCVCLQQLGKPPGRDMQQPAVFGLPFPWCFAAGQANTPNRARPRPFPPRSPTPWVGTRGRRWRTRRATCTWVRGPPLIISSHYLLLPAPRPCPFSGGQAEGLGGAGGERTRNRQTAPAAQAASTVPTRPPTATADPRRPPPQPPPNGRPNRQPPQPPHRSIRRPNRQATRTRTRTRTTSQARMSQTTRTTHPPGPAAAAASAPPAPRRARRAASSRRSASSSERAAPRRRQRALWPPPRLSFLWDCARACRQSTALCMQPPTRAQRNARSPPDGALAVGRGACTPVPGHP
jgi:hypothetical protein